MPLSKTRKPVRLNIGSGAGPKPGFINCDLHGGPGVDRVFDCQGHWPFEDGSVERIEADHVLEHLAEPLAFFKEAWRVLQPNGQMCIRVPYGWNSAAWWDLTHLRPWIQESFACLQPGFCRYSRNHQEIDLGCAFWVNNVVMIIETRWVWLWRHKITRPIVTWAGRHLLNVYRELIAEMQKTSRDDSRSKAYGGTRHPAVVPCSYGVWSHEYHKRSPEETNGMVEIIVFQGKETEE